MGWLPFVLIFFAGAFSGVVLMCLLFLAQDAPEHLAAAHRTSSLVPNPKHRRDHSP